MLYTVELVYAVQLRESAIRVHISSLSSQNIKFPVIHSKISVVSYFIQSEVSQKEKNKCYILTHTCGI